MKKYSIIALFLLTIAAVVSFWPEKQRTWHEQDGFRWAELSLPWIGKTGFKMLPPAETGITFSNNLTEEQLTKNRHLLNGSGVAVGDIDGDGLADIYFCCLDGPNILYKNLGNWQFEEITELAGVACENQFSTGTALADIDGDSDLDLLVTTLGGPNFCFVNDGRGRFEDVTASSGLTGNLGATTLALADIDGDNDLDLYIADYKKRTVKDRYLPQTIAFDNVVKKNGDMYEIAAEFREDYTIDYLNDEILMRYETAEPDQLYLNDGKGRFEAVSFTNGRFLDEDGKPISELKDWGLTVRFQDMDDDGDPDIYVCNDFESPDRIWINDGSGNFQALPRMAMRNTSWATMGIDFSDIDRDGDQDFLLLDMLARQHSRRKMQRHSRAPVLHPIGTIDNRPQYSRNTLFLNRGDGTYAEIAQYSGIQASDWSWSPVFMDIDLDGYEDVIIATGHFYDAINTDALDRIGSQRYSDHETWQKQILTFPALDLPNAAFRNRGDLIFEDVSEAWGFTMEDISHGMALGDFDNDGDLDVVMNRLYAPAAIYRNESKASRLAVRLCGLTPNTQGIGAKIRVLGGPVQQSKEVIAAGTYLSSSDPVYTFATGETGNSLAIEVKWRDGKISVVEHAKANRIYEISESAASLAEITSSIGKSESLPYFEDASDLIDHKHHENAYNDFRYQLLLPKKLSQLGPGIAWHDLDGDGDDDLIIGSGKDGALACFQNNGKDGFARIYGLAANQQSSHDQGTILGWWENDSISHLLVANSNLEERQTNNASVSYYSVIKDHLKFHPGRDNGRSKSLAGMGGDGSPSSLLPNDSIITDISSPGPMAMADYDLDGDLDLFVGGRAIPGRYPEPASSLMYLNQDGDFQFDSRNSAIFREIGLVSGVVFSDYDGDGDADLILAIEWGSVAVFRNDNGAFTDATSTLGLHRYLGLWQGVTTGDLDSDGRLDIIATNWGLNSSYQWQYNLEHPLELYCGDFDFNGTLEVVESWFDPVLQKRVPVRNLYWLQLAMPSVSRGISDNRTYSTAGIAEIIGPRFKDVRKLQANTLAHTVFFNRGDRFEAVEMPAKAQFAPAFYVGVADFDGDGYEDVFSSQNFFASQIENSRSDAGRGLWLKGDGSGKLAPLPGQESGVKVYGEQRGAALSDYDRDGRVDLVVSQNGAATRLYHNIKAKPGLRIRLAGPPGNRDGVGATIRLVYENGIGPAREIHLGSGYWSQDSMVQVMGMRDKVKDVWVRWPGGKTTNTPLPVGANEVTVDVNGKANVNF